MGGPNASADNGNPNFDLAENFSPGIQNSGLDADGMALFDVPALQLTSSIGPIDAVIYGESNTYSLMDETGASGAVDVGDATDGQALLRTGSDSWTIAAPDPSNCPAF